MPEKRFVFKPAKNSLVNPGSSETSGLPARPRRRRRRNSLGFTTAGDGSTKAGLEIVVIL